MTDVESFFNIKPAIRYQTYFILQRTVSSLRDHSKSSAPSFSQCPGNQWSLQYKGNYLISGSFHVADAGISTFKLPDVEMGCRSSHKNILLNRTGRKFQLYDRERKRVSPRAVYYEFLDRRVNR